ncbi:MAG: hypothetical protein ACXABY_21695 [Candidatus Thorarchaeota archaeon]|jgi:hypothetical protein
MEQQKQLRSTLMLKRIEEEDNTHFRFLAGLMLFQTIALAVFLGQVFLFLIPTRTWGEAFAVPYFLIASIAPPVLTYNLWKRHENSIAITRAWLIVCIHLLVLALIANNPNWLVLQLALGVPLILGLPVSLIYHLREHGSFFVRREDVW